MPDPIPLILDDAGLKISKTDLTTGLTELACLASHIELTPETSVTTLDTFCGSKDYPGTVKWSLIATLYQSFDVAGTEEVLSAALAVDKPVPYEVVGRKGQPVSATNPTFTGLCIPQAYSPINGDAGDASTIELEWGLTAAPTKGITPGVFAASADYESLTLAELQEAAGHAGLATSGTKAELIERLTSG